MNNNYPHPPQDQSAAVLCWRDGAVAHMRFNRPQALNAIDPCMAKEFLEACQAIADDPQVRVVWVSAEGRAFMAGGDLSTLQSDPLPVAQALIAGMHAGMRLLASLAAPVVASVHGAVAGGGLGLMLGCDLVIAAEGTRFNMAYPLIGASCDCSTSWGLPRLIGLRRALELALLGDHMDTAEALRLGLVNRVVPATDLTTETERIVQRLAQGPTLAFGHLKRLLRSSFQNDLDGHLNLEAQGFLACAQTKDFKEGVSAFLEKRPAQFVGA
jgi:2-(1,2-epoxy-1,2-dihydrophenyl)acetyl-CoA isomerase